MPKAKEPSGIMSLVDSAYGFLSANEEHASYITGSTVDNNKKSSKKSRWLLASMSVRLTGSKRSLKKRL